MPLRAVLFDLFDTLVDLRVDVAGAAALGIGTVWITRRVSDPERALREHAGPPPDWRIRDLAELPRVLDEAAARRA